MLNKIFYQVKASQELINHIPKHISVISLGFGSNFLRIKKWVIPKALSAEGRNI